MLKAEQVRAARALLNWTQQELGEKSGLSLTTIKRMESIGTGRSAAENVDAVQRTLEQAGVVFIPSNGAGVGVRLARRED
jgi:transcriptional regulator with XRE-family HTH domain